MLGRANHVLVKLHRNMWWMTYVMFRPVFLCNWQFLFIMTRVTALNDQVSLQVHILVLALNILFLDFCFPNSWVSCSLSCFHMRAFISSMTLQSGRYSDWQQCYVHGNCGCRQVLFVLFHSLPWILLFQLSQFWTTAQTRVIAGTMVGIVVGRRFVLIGAELRWMDRIQTGRKEEDTKAPSQGCRQIRKTVKKRLEKWPGFGLWMS